MPNNTTPPLISDTQWVSASPGSRENHVCNYCGTSSYIRREGDLIVCTGHQTMCPDCHEWLNSGARCDACSVRCDRENCRRWRRRTTMVQHGEQLVCAQCAEGFRNCEGCNVEGHTNDNIVWCADINQWRHNSGYGTSECEAYYCDNHGGYHVDECNYVEYGTPRNCGGYHHTRPSMWLGGPLPRNHRGQQQGYYVGFELEITAKTTDDCNIITAWSEKRLGVNIFDCKSDSSVEGFEIAVQPMTPEFFERVPWDDFFDMINENFQEPQVTDEPDAHGLHVHIGKVAFRSDVNIAAFGYLLTQGEHLARIGRRNPTGYCRKVDKPVSATLAKKGSGKQAQRVIAAGARAGRDQINLGNEATIEVRAFKSTRTADNLRAAVRTVYLAADYVRYLTTESRMARAQALHWSEFSKWVAVNHPEAFPVISGLTSEVALQKAALNALNDEAADLLSVPVNYQF